jgi:hypothetical protein
LLAGLKSEKMCPEFFRRQGIGFATFDVFLSNRGVDKDYCRLLWALLESLGITVYFDQAYNTLDNFQDRLAYAMQHCRVGVLVLSPEYFTSEWCRWELKTIAKLAEDKKFRVFSVQLSPFLHRLPSGKSYRGFTCV